MGIIFNSKKNVRKNVYKRDSDVNSKKHNITRPVNNYSISNLFKKLDFSININNTLISKISLAIMFALCIFIVISFIIIKSYNYAIVSDYFSIEEIEFKNNKILSNEDLLEVTGLEVGSNILKYNITELKFKLLENSWIENVTIHRDLPNKFLIEVQEKVPFFWITHNESIYYLDKDLNYIAPVTEENFISLPTLRLNGNDEIALKNISLFIDELNNANLPFSINEISWFSINNSKVYEFYLENLNLNIIVEIHNFDQGVQNLALVLHDLKKRNEINKIKSIIVASNQVTIEKN